MFPTEWLLGFHRERPRCCTPLWSVGEKHVWTWGTPCSHLIQLTRRLTGWRAVAVCCSHNPLHFHLSDRERARVQSTCSSARTQQLQHLNHHVGIPAAAFPNSRNMRFTLMMCLEFDQTAAGCFSSLRYNTYNWIKGGYNQYVII